MSLLDKLKKFEKKDTQKEPISEPQKIFSVKELENSKKAQISSFVEYKTKQNKLKNIKDNNTEYISSIERQKDVDWDKVSLSQDDLWFLFRLKFGIGTRIKRSELLPKFTEVFNKNLKNLTKE